MPKRRETIVTLAISIVTTISMVVSVFTINSNIIFADNYVCESYSGDTYVGGYTSFQNALDELNGTNPNNIDKIVLLDDVVYSSNGTGLFNILNSVTIDGYDGQEYHAISGWGNRGGNSTTLAINNGGSSMIDVILKNLTVNNSKEGGRAIETRGNIRSFTLENCEINTTGNGGWEQGITIGGWQDSIANVRLIGTKVLVGQQGYAVCTFNPVDMYIGEYKTSSGAIIPSNIQGYTSLNIKGPTSSHGSNGSTINIENSLLGSHNYNIDPNENFSTITIEDVGITININNCDIETGSESNGINSFLSLQFLFWNGVNYGCYYSNDQNEVQFVSDNPVRVNISGDDTKIGFNGTSWEFASYYEETGGNSYDNNGEPYGKLIIDCTGGIYTVDPAKASTTKRDYPISKDEYPNYVNKDYISIPNVDESTKDKYPYRIVKLVDSDKNTTDQPGMVLEANQVDNSEVEKNSAILTTQVTDNDLINIKASSAELLPEAKQIVKSNRVVTEATNNGYDGVNEDVIVVNTYFDIELQSVHEADDSTTSDVKLDKVVMDIVPKYSAFIYDKNNAIKKVLYSNLELGIPIDRTVTLKVFLPDNFVVDKDTDKVWVKHWLSEDTSKVYGGNDGLSIYQDSDENSPTYKGYYVIFDNPDDFSVFEFTRYIVTSDSPNSQNNDSSTSKRPAYKIVNTGVR